MTSLVVMLKRRLVTFRQTDKENGRLTQRFSNFFDHGPLFSSGIVGGPPHFRVATFALSQSGTGVCPFPPLPPFPLAIPFLSFSHSLPSPLEVGTPALSQLRLEGLGDRSSFPSGFGWNPVAKRILTHFRPKLAPF